jgi:hypothetical protein
LSNCKGSLGKKVEYDMGYFNYALKILSFGALIFLGTQSKVSTVSAAELTNSDVNFAQKQLDTTDLGGVIVYEDEDITVKTFGQDANIANLINDWCLNFNPLYKGK